MPSSVFPVAHSVSFTDSIVTSVGGDQFNNCTFVSPGPQADDERQAIADWLSLLDFSLTQNKIFHRRAEGTGQWLLESKEFKEWRDGVSKTLFCPGMPGAGKTALVSIVINHLQTRFENENKSKIAIAYIYLDYKKQAQQSLSSLVSSLLKQLIQIRICSLNNVKAFYQRHKGQNTRPTLDDLTKALKTELSKLSKAFIIVDAVDELTEDNGARANLLTLLTTLADNINLMVTSRHIDTIAVYFQDTRRLEIRGHDEDVRKYIQSRIPRWWRSKLVETVTEEIVKKAEGMFLMARLHMDSLSMKHSPAKVIEALKTLPTGMDQTYDEAMKRIQQQDEDGRALAYRVLSWIVFAYRPLSVDELQCALAVSPDMAHLDHEEIVFKECLTSYCAGLVIIDEESQITRLIHYTAQEYFESRRERLFPDAQTIITRTCLTYLLFDEFDGFHSVGDLFLLMGCHPLLEYTAQYWGRHASGLMEETEKPLLLKFLRSPHHVALSSHILLKNEYSLFNHIPLPSLHLCAFLGLCHTIKHLLDNGEDLNLRDSWGRTPLSWAAYKGQNGIVSLLLAHEGIDINGKGEYGQTPLSFAAEQGHDGTVSLLLAHEGININAKDDGGRTPLSHAAKWEHEGIVRLLLAHEGIDINAKDDYDRPPLLYAAEQGRDEIVRLLLTHEGIEINAKNNGGWTSLSFAAERGHNGIVRLLLAQEGIDINAKNKHGQTPLSHAAKRGYEGIARLLLAQEGIDINTNDKYGRTPLSYSAKCGHYRVVRLLLSQEGIGINAEDKDGRTPLSYAAERGHERIVYLLLAHKGIGINAKDKDGQTPLSHAAKWGDDGIMNLLLAHEGIDINTKDEYGRTPLSFAAKRGHDEIVCLLLARKGIDINAKDNDGRTPLSLAAIRGHDGIVRLLLAHEGININAKDGFGQTPLLHAARWGYDEIVRLLLVHEGIDINAKNEYGRTSISYAAERGHKEIVRLLLAHEGININAENTKYRTALTWATGGGHDEIVRLLLAHEGKEGINTNTKEEYGRTLLSLPAIEEYDGIMNLLFAQEGIDTDINAKERNGFRVDVIA